MNWTKITIEEIIANDEIRVKFTDEYYRLTGLTVDCSGCPGQMVEPFEVLRRNERNEFHPLIKKNMSDKKYIFKQGPTVYCRALGIMLTSANMTDNNARVLLNSMPQAATLFEKLPDNWAADSAEFAKKLEPKPKVQPPIEAPIVTPTTEVEKVAEIIEAGKNKKANKKGKK